MRESALWAIEVCTMSYCNQGEQSCKDIVFNTLAEDKKTYAIIRKFSWEKRSFDIFFLAVKNAIFSLSQSVQEGCISC